MRSEGASGKQELPDAGRRRRSACTPSLHLPAHVTVQAAYTNPGCLCRYTQVVERSMGSRRAVPARDDLILKERVTLFERFPTARSEKPARDGLGYDFLELPLLHNSLTEFFQPNFWSTALGPFGGPVYPGHQRAAVAVEYCPRSADHATNHAHALPGDEAGTRCIHSPSAGQTSPHSSCSEPACIRAEGAQRNGQPA